MSHGGSITYKIILASLATILLTLVILLIIIIIYSRKKSVESEENLPVQRNKQFSAHSYLFNDLDTATDGFNPRNIIGKGRLGTVYYAYLNSSSSSSSSSSSPSSTTSHHDIDIIALKRINPCFVLSNAGFGFSKIIKSLSLANEHPNILSILGFSEAPGERIILMEYMHMKSLDFHLHHNLTILDWRKRLRIAAGAARGIEHLHEGRAPSIVHGCVKPSNILIDENFSARVCDYGLCFLAPPQEMIKAGSLKGYVDREFLVEKSGFCKENDVYGFGVVLLEILSGRKCDEDGFFVKWMLNLIKDDLKIFEVLDSRVLVPLDVKPLIRLAKVASACVSNTRKNRPSIAQVATILNNLESQI